MSLHIIGIDYHVAFNIKQFAPPSSFTFFSSLNPIFSEVGGRTAMESGQCWMWWTKRSYSLSPNLTSSTKTSYDDSWEEQAFAKDAAGTLGGCIWPPRSYSCSFCRREFRSAQALGGHMNVHRRDRARFKQRSSTQNEIPYQELQTLHQNPLQNPFSSPDYRYPSPVHGFAYKTNPNSNSFVLASPSTALDNCIEETLISSYDSSILRGENKASSVYSPKFWSNLSEDICTHKFDIIESGESDSVKITKKVDSGSRFEADNDESHEALKFQTKETAIISSKRKRTDASSIEFFPKSSSIDQLDDMQSEMCESSPLISMEELDLELRLGHSPKV